MPMLKGIEIGHSWIVIVFEEEVVGVLAAITVEVLDSCYY